MSQEKKKAMDQEDIDPEYVVDVDSDLNFYGDDNNSVQQVPTQRRRSRLGVPAVFADIDKKLGQISKQTATALYYRRSTKTLATACNPCHHEHTLLRFSTV